jgi:endonuclease-3 related protein
MSPVTAKHPRNIFIHIYRQLYSAFGPQHWWPGESIEEIIIGAVLTQNTSWQNVTRAIDQLKRDNALSLRTIIRMPENNLARMIRSAGYFKIKTRRLKAVAHFWIQQWHADWRRVRRAPLASLRTQLLDVYGVGPETADSMLLYAFNKPTFVVDAYTRRIGERHRLFPADAKYPDIQKAFESAIPRRPPLYNEYHALLVRLGKEYCRAQPRCFACPLHHPVFYRKKIGELSIGRKKKGQTHRFAPTK